MTRPYRTRSAQLPVTPRSHLEDLGTEQGLQLDCRLGAVSEADVVGHVELDEHPGSVQFDAGDLPDPETRDLHDVAGHQPARLSEIRGVGGALAEERQLVVVHRQKHQRKDQADADEADAKRAAFREGFHRGVHLPVGWSASLTYMGWPPLPLTFNTISQK